MSRARRTGKPQIVSAGKVANVPNIDRIYPVRFKPPAVSRSKHYLDERKAAELRLHGWICTEEDWTSVPAIIAPALSVRRRKPKVTWGNKYRGNLWGTHGIDECEGPTRTHIEKGRYELLDRLAAAAGLLPELAAVQPWGKYFMVREYGRANRRGSPSIKHPFIVWRPNTKRPRGSRTKKLRTVSLPR